MRRWIPKLKIKTFDFKALGAEAIAGLGLFAVFLNMFVVPRVHPFLSVPALIGIVSFAILFFMASGTNYGKSTLEAFIQFLKFHALQTGRQLPSQRTGGLKLKFMSFFNKGKVKVNQNVQNNHERISVASLEDSGVLDVGFDTYTDKSKKEYAVFQYEYKSIIGISDNIDDDNHHSQTLLFDGLQSTFKLYFPRASTNNLNDNYDFHLSLLEDTQYREEVEEMLMWLSYYNEQVQVIKTIDVEDSDIDSFHKNNDHLNVYRFTGQELVKHLHDRQLGGEVQ